MALKWTDKNDYTDDVMADDVNSIAHAVQDVENGNTPMTFSDTSTRANIASGDTPKTMFGKIRRWFADLKTVAFTGRYEDLSNRPALFSGKYSDLTGKPDLFSGSYNDLTDKPEIPPGAVVDRSLDGTSANPVQNKAIKAALDGKAEMVHKHVKSDITDFAHQHSKSDITDFPATMPPSAHTHKKSDITDLPSTFEPPDGSVTMDKLAADVKNAIAAGGSGGGDVYASTVSSDFSIPHTGWKQSADADGYNYSIDVTWQAATAEQTPMVTIKKSSLTAAGTAGLCPVAETISGAIRFWARRVPETDIDTSITLFAPSP